MKLTLIFEAGAIRLVCKADTEAEKKMLAVLGTSEGAVVVEPIFTGYPANGRADSMTLVVRQAPPVPVPLPKEAT